MAVSHRHRPRPRATIRQRTGLCPARRVRACRVIGARGFTLLELLVVVVILALFATFVVLNVNVVPRDAPLERQMQRLAAVLDLASEEALLQGRDFGVRVLAHGYEFYVFDQFAEAWQPIPGDDVLKARSIGEDLEFSLRMEDRDLRLNEPVSPTSPPQPQILVMSSGELSPFELRIERDGFEHGMTLVGSADGELEIRADEDRS